MTWSRFFNSQNYRSVISYGLLFLRGMHLISSFWQPFFFFFPNGHHFQQNSKKKKLFSSGSRYCKRCNTYDYVFLVIWWSLFYILEFEVLDETEIIEQSYLSMIFIYVCMTLKIHKLNTIADNLFFSKAFERRSSAVSCDVHLGPRALKSQASS